VVTLRRVPLLETFGPCTEYVPSPPAGRDHPFAAGCVFELAGKCFRCRRFSAKLHVCQVITREDVTSYLISTD